MNQPPSPHPADMIPPPDFDPVPTGSTRHDGWTVQRQRAFIAALNVMGAVAPAARAAGMTARSAYKLRARADAVSFAHAWDQALQTGHARAFDIALEQAMYGITTPLYYRGKQIGTRHRYDHRLLVAALAHHPMSAPLSAQQNYETARNPANFANFEEILASLTDPVDPGAPKP